MHFSDQFLQNAALSLLALIIITATIVVTKKIRGSVRKAKRLKTIYQLALRSGDRERAIMAGREYYAHLRGGIPTKYDEQVILDDVKGIPPPIS